MTNIYLKLWCVIILFGFGCTTYYLTTDKLVEQFINSTVEKKGYFFPNAVKGNSLKTITCRDNSGNLHTIQITDRTQIRITKNNNSRTTLYFNTLILKDSTITGSKTHFFNDQIKPITFSEISKIEIQE
jgi:hypothetical protein